MARYAGYCYGVERALGITGEALEHAGRRSPRSGRSSTTRASWRSLEERGVEVVDEVEDAPGGTLIVRTHGVAPGGGRRRARARGLDVVDATCPFVSVAQRKASTLREAGYAVVILGERDHPEVAGLEGFAGRGRGGRGGRRRPAAGRAARQAGRRGRADDADARQPGARRCGAGAPGARDCSSTTPSATPPRSARAPPASWPPDVDVVVVVGGRNSANTARLAQLCRAIEPRTHHVESAAELRPEWFAGARRIGVTAGASTPDDEIEATVQSVAGVRWRLRRDVRGAGAAAGRGRARRRRQSRAAGRRLHRRLNGAVPVDVLDLEMAAADGTFWLTVLRDGHPLDLVVAPKRGEWHGISLGFGGLGDRPPSAATAAASASSTRCQRGLRDGALRQGRRLPAVVPARQLHDADQSGRGRPRAHRGAAAVAPVRVAACLGRRGARGA